MGYVEDLRARIGHMRINLNGSLVILENGQGQILLQQRAYPRGRWGLPGGIMELGESTEETARREVLEETGIVVGALHLIGVFSGKDQLCRAANGDEWYTIVTAYRCRDFVGDAQICDDESLAFEWVSPDALPEDMAKSHRRIIEIYLGKDTVI